MDTMSLPPAHPLHTVPGILGTTTYTHLFLLHGRARARNIAFQLRLWGVGSSQAVMTMNQRFRHPGSMIQYKPAVMTPHHAIVMTMIKIPSSPPCVHTDTEALASACASLVSRLRRLQCRFNAVMPATVDRPQPSSPSLQLRPHPLRPCHQSLFLELRQQLRARVALLQS